MAMILKCKMCGGDIEVNKEITVGSCLYCGSIMTLPRVDSDKKARMFNRANQYRLNNEFDKAYDAYKAIVEEDEKEAEAYWGMLLSEYGVEYVEDPISKKRIPTCHRTHVKSIKTSADFEMACKYADAENRMMYQDEADEIEGIQKKILSISSKLEPYEVFICYKESEEGGERTLDSVLAQDIYTELERQGIRAFFSRISLKEKLGQDYEPNIFAALQSAKVMLMVTTSNEHCNAVWVKNEWSRYIGFMKENTNKVLIPVCKDINPYELPPELAKFQAQDMNRVGAMQDLIYAVKQIVAVEAKEKKDIVLEALVKEKIEQEEKKREKQVKVAQTKAVAKKISIYLAVAIAVAMLIFGGIKIYQNVILPNNNFKQAQRHMEVGEYDNALELLYDLQGKKETGQLIRECKYQKARLLYEIGDYEGAYRIFTKDAEYLDAKDYISRCAKELQILAIKKNPDSGFIEHFKKAYKGMRSEDLYDVAKAYYDNVRYVKAKDILENILDYDGAKELYGTTMCDLGEDFYQKGRYSDALSSVVAATEVDNARGRELLEKYQQEIYDKGMIEYQARNWEKAQRWFGMLALLGKYTDESNIEMYKKCLEKI